jgi:S1-C subfamily serine protease
MSEDIPDPRPAPRHGGGSTLAWALPLALTALVIVLAWKLYQSMPKGAHDPRAEPKAVTARGDLADDEKATIAVFRAASPAVVQVTNIVRATDWMGTNSTEIPQGTGSGFVWDANGYVVTNFHVVAQGDSFTVTFANHATFEATPVGSDEEHDLAVLKIDPKGQTIPALPLGTSHDLLVGQKVFAIGNPFGLDQTLTTGIISGLNREIVSLAKTPILGVIQTDAAINPGNSGGPLLDSGGRVIGLNTQIASPSGASAGVGFAIPVDTLNRIVPELIRTGKYLRPGLGVALLPDWVAARLGTRGVVIRDLLANSTAGSAGLRASTISGTRLVKIGDSIVAIDGQQIASRGDLIRVLDTRRIGDQVDVTYLREGEEHTAKVKLVGVQ